MTLEELGNKTINITLNVSFKVSDDLDEGILKDILEDPNPLYSLSSYYSTIDDILDVTDFNDYKVSIE